MNWFGPTGDCGCPCGCEYVGDWYVKFCYNESTCSVLDGIEGDEFSWNQATETGGTNSGAFVSSVTAASCGFTGYFPDSITLRVILGDSAAINVRLQLDVDDGVNPTLPIVDQVREFSNCDDVLDELLEFETSQLGVSGSVYIQISRSSSIFCAALVEP